MKTCNGIPGSVAGGMAIALMLLGVVGIVPGSSQDRRPGRSSYRRPAEEERRETRLLTLEEAVERARSTNPAYERSVNDLELNEVENREFWLDFLPEPRVTLLRTDMQWNRTTIGTDNFGNPIPNPEVRMVQSATSDQFASLVWDLDFRDFYRRQATRLRGRERTVAVERAANDLTADVRVAFLDAQELWEAHELEVRMTNVRATNQEIAERRFRLAQVDRPDLLGAELDHVEQQARLQDVRGRLSSALLRLRNVIGDPELSGLAVSPAPLRIFDPTVLDSESLVAEALMSGPDVRIAAVGVGVAERDVSLGRAEWLPTLEVSASMGRRQLSRESGGAFLQPIPDGEWDRTVGFTLRLPDLGTYFRRGAAGRREAVEVRNARSLLRETRMRVEEAVRNLVLELQTQHRSLEVQDRRAELARERLELQQERYRLGQIDYRELQSSVETAADAERRALEARYGFERALVELERARGAPLRITPRQPRQPPTGN